MAELQTDILAWKLIEEVIRVSDTVAVWYICLSAYNMLVWALMSNVNIIII